MLKIYLAIFRKIMEVTKCASANGLEKNDVDSETFNFIMVKE